MKGNSYQRFLKNFNLEECGVVSKYINSKEEVEVVSDSTACLKIINKLQYRFSSMIDKIYLREAELKPLYDQLIYYLQKLEQNPSKYPGYSTWKLSNRNPSDQITVLKRERENIKDGAYSAGLIGYRLEDLGEILREVDLGLNDREVKEMRKSVSGLWERKVFYEEIQRIKTY